MKKSLGISAVVFAFGAFATLFALMGSPSAEARSTNFRGNDPAGFRLEVVDEVFGQQYWSRCDRLAMVVSLEPTNPSHATYPQTVRVYATNQDGTIQITDALTFDGPGYKFWRPNQVVNLSLFLQRATWEVTAVLGNDTLPAARGIPSNAMTEISVIQSPYARITKVGGASRLDVMACR